MRRSLRLGSSECLGGFMKEILFSIMSVCISASAIGILAPEGKGALKKQVTFACSLAVCVAVMSPLISIISKENFITVDLENPDVTAENLAKDEIIRIASENICTEMERIAEERFGIVSPSLTLNIDSSDPEAIRLISGHLSGEGRLAEAAEYIGKELGCEIGYEE